MSWRSLLLTVAIAALLLAGTNRVVRRMSANSVPRQVMRTIEQAPPTIDILGIGNSVMKNGFDSGAVEDVYGKAGKQVIAVNGGLGASGVIEHLLLTRMALRGHTVKTLVYGFFDFQLMTDVPQKNSDLFGNRAMLYYVEPEVVLKYAHFDPVETIGYQTYRLSDLLIERAAIWAKVEKLRRKLSEIGMPSQATNQLGRVSDFDLLEPSSQDTFIRECNKAFQSTTVFSAPVEALLSQARQSGARVILIEMPMHPNHLAKYYSQPEWQKLRERIREAAESRGVGYLDASHWIQQAERFEDHLHLSEAGAKQFSQMMAGWLIEFAGPKS
jgi:hypothetical protein